MVERILAVLRQISQRWKQAGSAAAMRFAAGKIFRHQITLVYAADLRTMTPAPDWQFGEHVLEVGPENIEAVLQKAELRTFLGGEAASETLDGVRRGDRIFIVADTHSFLHRGSIMFHNVRERKLAGEVLDAPVIGFCYTAPAARGRGLYRRALLAELQRLKQGGYDRAIIETDPTNEASRRGIEGAGFRLARESSAWILFSTFAVRRTRDSSGSHWRALFL